MSEQIDILNRKYGEPGRIAFREGAGKFPLIILAGTHGACEVSLYGGQILSYRPVGHAPVLWCARSVERIRDGGAMRGGIPVCWPWFGKGHGFARNLCWRLDKTEHSANETSVTLQLASSPALKERWPHDFLLSLKITLADKLRLDLTTTNAGAEAFEIAEALHSYFLVRNFCKVRVEKPDTTIPHEGIDEIFDSADITAIIHDDEIGRKIVVEKLGSAQTVVWNPGPAKAAEMSDLAPGEYERFICVEAANTKPVTIAPNESHTMSMAIYALLK